mmetsp:Transcript_69957/g.116184  ORF Transcript_69957/g.116184 Transcript_69957/m.116184 type:complete len:130 (-) Transcript_69957:172-561(-)
MSLPKLPNEPPKEASVSKVELLSSAQTGTSPEPQESCAAQFDRFLHCMAIGNQIFKYYHEGTYADCPRYMRSWNTCLRSKITGQHEAAEAVRHQEWQESVPGTHVWDFKSEYKEEAYWRYGISSRGSAS